MNRLSFLGWVLIAISVALIFANVPGWLQWGTWGSGFALSVVSFVRSGLAGMAEESN